MRFPNLQGPKIQMSRRHRAIASFVDEWQVRIIAIGPYYLRLTKRPKFNNRVAESVAQDMLNSNELLGFENRLKEQS